MGESGLMCIRTQKNVKKKLVLKPSTSIICSDLGAELAELAELAVQSLQS